MILRMVLVGCWFLGLSLGTSLQAQNVIADSADDWSSEGTQGENNWFNGYYNFTDDEFNGDGVYQAEDFIEFENVDGPGGGPFDETDAAVLFENVHVPWDNVFLHDNVEMTRAIYTLTPGHSLANHQANVRFLEKLKLLVAVAHAITRANKADGIPAVQTVLGDLAAKLATLEGLIMGQLHGCEEMVPGSGYVTVNRRYMYAALHWCTTNHSEICDIIRDLMGGGPFQMPADSSVLADPELAAKFETYWSSTDQTAKQRMKLLRLAWDLVGSEFAGRHMQYEKFYAGPGFVMSAYSYLNCPWDALGEIVTGLLSSYDVEPPG